MHVRSPTDAEVLARLERVIDPETGVNIVELGLVYGIFREEDRLRICMTMTTPTCAAGTTIIEAVHCALAPLLPAGTAMQVELCWSPIWTPARATPAARARLDQERWRVA